MPRVFEKVYNSAEQKAEAGGKGKIFRSAAQTAVDHSMLEQEGKKIPLLMKIKFALFDRLVYSKLRAAMGGRVVYAVSGSAPLGSRLGHFFHSLGLTILEGYGLTETTAPATVNLATKSKIGTVGPVLPGVGVRLADDGEIQVRGIDVFKEYWRNPEATAAAFDGDWFKTGDIGTFDDEGFLTITGRKKEIIVTAGGKNVAPAVLEDPIRAQPDRRPGRRRRRPEAVHLGASSPSTPRCCRRGSATTACQADMSLAECAKNERRARRGAEGDRPREQERVARRVDPQVHDPLRRVDRGQRPPHAEDEHQAQRHHGRLRRPRSTSSTACPSTRRTSSLRAA